MKNSVEYRDSIKHDRVRSHLRHMMLLRDFRRPHGGRSYRLSVRSTPYSMELLQEVASRFNMTLSAAGDMLMEQAIFDACDELSIPIPHEVKMVEAYFREGQENEEV